MKKGKLKPWLLVALGVFHFLVPRVSLSCRWSPRVAWRVWRTSTRGWYRCDICGRWWNTEAVGAGYGGTGDNLWGWCEGCNKESRTRRHHVEGDRTRPGAIPTGPIPLTGSTEIT